MKTFILAATVAAGLLCSASSADAQFRRSRVYNSYPSYSYSYPSYGYSYTDTSSYSYPTYSYATPSYYNSGVVTTGGYTSDPFIYSSGGTYYSTPHYGTYYSTPHYGSYYNSGYYNNGYNNSYYGGSGVYSNGMYMGGRRLIRW